MRLPGLRLSRSDMDRCVREMCTCTWRRWPLTVTVTRRTRSCLRPRNTIRTRCRWRASWTPPGRERALEDEELELWPPAEAALVGDGVDPLGFGFGPGPGA